MMTSLTLVGIPIFIVAVAMTMVGKGGGNFYVVILAIAGIPMHEAATIGQLILFTASLAAMVIFQKNRSISWGLALLVGTFTAFSALGGGYFSHLFSGFTLKMIFAAMLVAAGIIMLLPAPVNRVEKKDRGVGFLNIRSGDEVFQVNLWITIPVTILAGFGSGMVGVSGGSFLVPLMVAACGVPMRTAVGTASALIAVTAFMGFSGHAVNGDFNPAGAIPLAIITIAGGLIGGKIALKTRPRQLQRIFAFTNWLAAFFMVLNALHDSGSI